MIMLYSKSFLQYVKNDVLYSPYFLSGYRLVMETFGEKCSVSGKFLYKSSH